jgi:hypothetical protein
LSLALAGLTLIGGLYVFFMAQELAQRGAIQAYNTVSDRRRELLELELRVIGSVGDTVNEIGPRLRDYLGTLAGLGPLIYEAQQGVRALQVTADAYRSLAESGVGLVRETETFLRRADVVSLSDKIAGEETLRERLIRILDPEQVTLLLQQVQRGIGHFEASMEYLRGGTQQWDIVMRLQERTQQELMRVVESAGETLNQHIARIRKTLEPAEAPPALEPKEASGTIAVSILTTRIGAVALLIFLVQILTSIFRYQIRLAAFFDARADALAAVTGTGGLEEVERLVKLLDATRIAPHVPRSPLASLQTKEKGDG